MFKFVIDKFCKGVVEWIFSGIKERERSFLIGKNGIEKVFNGRIIFERINLNFLLFYFYVFVVFKFLGFCKGLWKLFYVEFVVGSKVGILNGIGGGFVILFGIFFFGISDVFCRRF